MEQIESPKLSHWMLKLAIPCIQEEDAVLDVCNCGGTMTLTCKLFLAQSSLHLNCEDVCAVLDIIAKLITGNAGYNLRLGIYFFNEVENSFHARFCPHLNVQLY